MFNGCQKLKYIDLSNFHPMNKTNMTKTFYSLSSLVYLNIPHLEIYYDADMSEIFDNILLF